MPLAMVTSTSYILNILTAVKLNFFHKNDNLIV